MCSLVLTACNDDDSIIDRTGGNNLQVEVPANFHSRAPIHGSTLPDNNPIGVTLTAKDGSSYDNQNYNNIPYSATTADGKQTWMPQDKPVTLSVTEGVAVDGRKYNTAVEVSEAYKQGYIYTYNLTLDNTALNVSAVAVTPWEEEISVEAPEPVAEDDQYIVEVTIDSDNYTYIHNIVNFVGIVDWGDGTQTTYDTQTTRVSHIYNTAGKYLVVCSGKATAINSIEIRQQNASTCDISKLIHIGGEMGITSMMAAFKGHVKLTEIPEGIFDGLTEVTSFGNTGNGYGCFGGCKSITEIPAGLFDNCPEVINFQYVFYQTGITSIPEGLFDNCPNVTNFNCTFSGCTGLAEIPEGLFDYNTKVTTFASTFDGCKSITEIPTGLFDKCPNVTNFSSTFNGCTGLTGIPTGLFDNNTEVTNFSNTFIRSGIIEIPEGLFKNNTEVTNFSGAFSDCYGITSIPAGLFDNNPEVTNFGGTFWKCNSLTSIPTGLFDKCTKVTNFGGTFKYCSKLTGESPYTIINIDGEDKKVHLYERSLYPEHFTAPTSYGNCFSTCNKLTDFAEITAAGWI